MIPADPDSRAEVMTEKKEIVNETEWVADFSAMNETQPNLTEEYKESHVETFTEVSGEWKNEEEVKIMEEIKTDTKLVQDETKLETKKDTPDEKDVSEIQETKEKKIIPAMTDDEVREDQKDKESLDSSDEDEGEGYATQYPGVLDDKTAARALKRRLLSVKRTTADDKTTDVVEGDDEKKETIKEVVAVEEVIAVKTEKPLVSILKKQKDDTDETQDKSEDTTNPFGEDDDDEIEGTPEIESITDKSDQAETSSESQDLGEATKQDPEENTEELPQVVTEDKLSRVTEPKLILLIGKSGAIKLKNPSHIVTVDDESGLIVDTQHTYVLQVNVKGEILHKYDVKHNVRSVAVFGKKVFIASKEKIYTFAIKDVATKPLEKLRPKGDIFSIALADKDTILICDQTKGQILEFKIREGTTTVRLSGLEQPVFISTADTPDGRCYVVSVKGSNRVHIYSSEWQLVAWFDGTTFGDEPLKGVSGTAFTSATTFLVADTLNDRISEYNIDGTFVRHVLLSSNGIHYPAFLAYKNGRLWVTESEGAHKLVKVYRIPDPPKEKIRTRQISEQEAEEASEDAATGKIEDTLLMMQTNRQNTEGIAPGKKPNNPYEIAFTNFDSVMVCDKGLERVQELDIVGQVILEYRIKEPVVSVTTLDDTLYIASESTIFTYKIGSNDCLGMRYPQAKITNIAVPSAELVLICNFDTGMVFEFNMETKTTTRKLSGLEQPRCITFGETSKGTRYLVTLWGHLLSHCVNVYTKDWELLTSINGQGSGFGHLFQPVGTKVTSLYTFWVAEGKKHQLSEYTFDGRFVRRVLWSKHGIHHPTSIAYTNGFVWVSECELQHGYDRIKLFKLLDPSIYPGAGMEKDTSAAETGEFQKTKLPEKILELNKGSPVRMKRPIQIGVAYNCIVMADKDLAAVQHINRSGKVVLEYSVKHTARGVAVCRDMVYIATKDTVYAFALGIKSNKPVKKFKTKVQKIFTIAVPDPSCIVMCDKHNGMIVEHKTADDTCRVVVGGLEMPHYVSVGETSEGRRYFVTLGGSLSAHSVNIYSQNWKLLGTATGRDSGDGQLRVPMGTCMNSPSTFLVADWANNRVTEFNIDGSFSRHVLWTKHGMFAPGDVAYKDGLLWVATYPFETSKESIRLFKMTE